MIKMIIFTETRTPGVKSKFDSSHSSVVKQWSEQTSNKAASKVILKYVYKIPEFHAVLMRSRYLTDELTLSPARNLRSLAQTA